VANSEYSIVGEVEKLTAKMRIGALISGGGSNLQAIIDSCREDKIDGRIVFAGSDNPDADGLARARKNNIPTFVVDYKAIIQNVRRHPEKAVLPDDFDFDELFMKQKFFSERSDPTKGKNFLTTRAIAEAELLRAMEPYPFDLLVLAGFMRNLTPYFIDRVNIDRFRPRIMNIHPSLLPAFAGLDGYGDTFRYGCKVGGCTVHFIDYGEDTGPIIGQRSFQIEPQDTISTIRKKGLKAEWALYSECIQLFAQKRLRVVRKEFDLGKGRKMMRNVVVITGSNSGKPEMKKG
jgi:phosphoribosylglycinamide formyltransferase-1